MSDSYCPHGVLVDATNPEMADRCLKCQPHDEEEFRFLTRERDDEGITLVIDFTRENEWDRIFDGAHRTFGGVGVRRTTSSRTPGKVNEGIVRRRHVPQLAPCTSCGVMRYELGGPHGPQVIGHDEVRDCAGVVWRKEGNTWAIPKE